MQPKLMLTPCAVRHIYVMEMPPYIQIKNTGRGKCYRSLSTMFEKNANLEQEIRVNTSKASSLISFIDFKRFQS